MITFKRNTYRLSVKELKPLLDELIREYNLSIDTYRLIENYLNSSIYERRYITINELAKILKLSPGAITETIEYMSLK